MASGTQKTLDDVPLARGERDALRAAARALAAAFPIERLLLFGSKARGDSGAESDIDILIITPRPIDWRDHGRIVDLLFDIGLEHDVIFSPLIVDSARWDRGSFSVLPIRGEIDRDGVPI